MCCLPIFRQLSLIICILHKIIIINWTVIIRDSNDTCILPDHQWSCYLWVAPVFQQNVIPELCLFAIIEYRTRYATVHNLLFANTESIHRWVTMSKHKHVNHKVHGYWRKATLSLLGYGKVWGSTEIPTRKKVHNGQDGGLVLITSARDVPCLMNDMWTGMTRDMTVYPVFRWLLPGIYSYLLTLSTPGEPPPLC